MKSMEISEEESIMQGTWIVCRNRDSHRFDPRVENPVMVVVVGDSTAEGKAFNEWLRRNNLHAYKDSYSKYFDMRCDLSEKIHFSKITDKYNLA